VGGGRTTRGEEGALTPLHFPSFFPFLASPAKAGAHREPRGSPRCTKQTSARNPSSFCSTRRDRHLASRWAPAFAGEGRKGSNKGKREPKAAKRQQPGTTKYLSPPAPAPSYSPTATSAEGRDRYRPAAWSSPVAPAVRGVTNRGRREAPQPAGRHYDRSPMMPRGAASRRVGRAAVSKARASGEKRSGPRRGSGIEDGPQDNAARLPTFRVRRGEPEIATAGARWVPSNADCPPGTYRAPANPRTIPRAQASKPRAQTRRGNADVWADHDQAEQGPASPMGRGLANLASAARLGSKGEGLCPLRRCPNPSPFISNSLRS
jgi:hypothetical protein